MKRFTSKTQKIGKIGEEICKKYFHNNNITVIAENYTKKVGEIDLIVKIKNKIHFIEVKSVSCETTDDVNKFYNPAENMTAEKIARCNKTIIEYNKENNVSCETQLDLYIVYIDKRNIKHKIEVIENIF